MTLLLGVLAASLVGSVHCAAMCGGFVCLYARVGAPSHTRGFGGHVAYNAGRLISYVTLGLVAGSLGARLDNLGAMARVERVAAVTAGTLMIVWAGTTIAASLGVRAPAFAAPTWLRQKFGSALIALRDQPPAVRAGAMGLLTTLLPCGWLYTFVVTAGGTANPIAGAAVMLAFWAGTIPMLLFVGTGVQRLSRPFAKRLPLASAALVLVLGALSVMGKLRPIATPDGASQSAHSHSHSLHAGR